MPCVWCVQFVTWICVYACNNTLKDLLSTTCPFTLRKRDVHSLCGAVFATLANLRGTRYSRIEHTKPIALNLSSLENINFSCIQYDGWFVLSEKTFSFLICEQITEMSKVNHLTGWEYSSKKFRFTLFMSHCQKCIEILCCKMRLSGIPLFLRWFDYFCSMTCLWSLWIRYLIFKICEWKTLTCVRTGQTAEFVVVVGGVKINGICHMLSVSVWVYEDNDYANKSLRVDSFIKDWCIVWKCVIQPQIKIIMVVL